MNTYKRRIQAAKQLSPIKSWYWLDRLWTSPRHTKRRWRFFADDCNWRCNYYDELRRPRKITTTNYALRRPRTTIATKYDYDDSSRGLASIGVFAKININTNYDYHELLIRRTMITMEYDYDDDSTTTATFLFLYSWRCGTTDEHFCKICSCRMAR